MSSGEINVQVQQLNAPTPPPKPPRTKLSLDAPSRPETPEIPCDKSTQSGPSFIDGNIFRKLVKDKSPKHKQDTTFNITTVQTIYKSSSDAEDYDTANVLQRSSSRVDKSMYAQLHRKSVDTQVNKLKESFEGAAENENESLNGETDNHNLEQFDSSKQLVQSVEVRHSVGPTNKEIGLLSAKFPPEALLAKKQRKSLPPDFGATDSYGVSEPKSRFLLHQQRLESPSTKTELLQKRRESQSLKVAAVKVTEISAPQYPRIIKAEPPGSDEDSSDEYRNIVLRSEPDDIDKTVQDFLSEIEMDSSKKPTKKRTGGIRRIFSSSFFSSKDKDKSKKEEDRNKALKNTKYLGHLTTASSNSNNQQSFSAFDRGAPQRHTTAGIHNSYVRNASVEPLYVNTSRGYESTNVANKSSTNFDDIQYNRMVQQQQRVQQQHLHQQPDHPLEDYVCMDNGQAVIKQRLAPLSGPSKYIDDNTSSSSNTISSENKSYTGNSPQISSKLPKVQNSSRRGPPVPPKVTGRTSAPTVSYTDRLERESYASPPERFSETPPRASETRPNVHIVKPRAVIPINTERQLPNYRDIQQPSRKMYGNGSGSPRTLERNMNTTAIKSIPEKNTVVFEDTYGTVFDSLKPVGAQLKTTRMSMQTAESLRARSMSPERNISSPTSIASSISPKSPTLEGTKLRLPPNRERVNVTPRITSPIDKRINAEKIIATELLKQKPGRDSSRALSPSHQRLAADLDYPDNVQNMHSLERVNNERIRSSSRNSQLSPVEKLPQQYTAPNQLTRSQSLTQHSTMPMQSRSRGTNYDVIVERRTMDPRMSLPRGSSMSQQMPRSPTKEETKVMLENYYWAKKQEEIVREDPYSSQTLSTRVVVHAQPRSHSMQALHMMRSPTPVILMHSGSSPVSHQQPTMRSSTPQLSPQRNSTAPSSPQKQQQRQNVEAFYWQELRRLKDEEEQQLFNKQMQMIAIKALENDQRRSRSTSPAVARTTRSMSLPRNPGTVRQPVARVNDLYGYTRAPPYQTQQMPIREGIPVDLNNKVVCYLSAEEYAAIRTRRIQEIQAQREGAAQRNNPNFVRGSSQRNTIGGPTNVVLRTDGNRSMTNGQQQQTYAPIFKRGSLASTATPPVPESSSPKDFNKRVSFSSTHSNVTSPVWPTKNGFTQSPPQRRIVKNDASALDDEVFLPNNPKSQNVEPVYGQRVADPSMQQQELQQQMSPTKTAKQHAAELYSQRKEVQRRTIPTSSEAVSIKAAEEELYGRAPKQISVNNKVCDFYGRIHDSTNYGQIQKTGVLYGHLQRSPVEERSQVAPAPGSHFVRGTRLTASVSDMYNNRRGVEQLEAPNRPLPPLPGQRIAAHYVLTPRRTGAVSDTESGSEAAGEVQRILLTGRHRTTVAHADRKNGFGES